MSLKLALGLGLGGSAVSGPDITAPTITSANSANNVENTVLAHALTANESVTWSIIGGADQARFEISGSTLRWASNGTKDYETPNDADTNNTYVVQVRATDGSTNTADQTITITVTDADEVAPTITSGNSANCAENAQLAHALTANESVTWTIIGGADQAQFSISGSTLRWVANGTQDYETPLDGGANNTYIVQVRATDAASNTADQTITITVTDVAEGGAPTDPALMWTAEGGYFFTPDTTAMFTTAAGMTNVSADGTAVELVLNKALMGGATASAFIAAASNAIVNGTFTTDLSSWTGTSWSHSASKALHAAGSNVSLTQTRATTDNSLYLVSATTSGRTAGNLKLSFGGGGATISTATWTTNAVVTAFLESNGNNNFEVSPSTTFDGSADDVVLKLVCTGHGLQTSTLRPLYQTTGYRRYNGSTQFMSSAASRCGASANFMWVRLITPAPQAGTIVFCGLEGAANAGAFWIGMNASGKLCAAVGTDGVATIVGTTDIYAKAGSLGLYANGTTVELWWCEEGGTPVLEYTGTQHGAPSTSLAPYEGAYNLNGTATGFAPADIAETGLFPAAVTAGEIENALRWNNT